MDAVTSEIKQAYLAIQSQLNVQTLGLIEIGSYATGEAISYSDRDFRLVIRTDEPYRILQEREWSEPVSAERIYLQWGDLNNTEGITFGISNTGWIERNIQVKRFPLGDHTALFQGTVVIDEKGALQSFRDQYAGVSFKNVLEDYHRQTKWRVENRLPSEAGASMKLDPDKYAIPLIHTCCRIMREMAQMDTYRTHSTYLQGFDALDAYYAARWPEAHPWFKALYAYKMDENQRKQFFKQVQARESSALQILQDFQTKVSIHWNKHKN